MAFPQFEVLSTTQEMDIIRSFSGSTAVNGIHLAVTDAGTIGSGESNRGIYVEYTNTGTKTGTSYCRGIHTEIDNTGTVSELYCFSVSVGSCSGTTARIAGVRFYQSAITGTCTNSTCLRLEHGGGATNNDYISFRKHGGTIRSILCNDATGHDYATNIYYQAGTTKPYRSTGCNVSGAGSSEAYLAVDIAGNTFGIPLIAIS